MKILSPSQVDLFQNNGYLKISSVFEEKYALKIQDEIWEELEEEFGIKKSDIKSWRTPPHSPKKAKFSPTNNNIINNKFRTIIDDLIGVNNWIEPKSWGGFLINFPNKDSGKWNLVKKLWHWDYELFRTHKLSGLLIFSFYSEVLSNGGGTLLVSGSHRALLKYFDKLTPLQKQMKHGKQRKHFMKTHPYFKQLSELSSNDDNQIDFFMGKETIIEGIPLKVIELTGNPGDVVFCHPRIIHAPAGININQFPRFMRAKFLW